MTNDNSIVVDPKGQSTPGTNGEVLVSSNTPIEPSLNSQDDVPEKFKGKTLREIAEIAENAQKKITEQADKLKKFAEALASEQKIEPAPVIEVESETNFSEIRKDLDIIRAKSDASMPKWDEMEKDILEIIETKPYLLESKTWTKDAYNLALATKLPELERLAEERGKAQSNIQSPPSDSSNVLDGGRQAPAPVAKDSIDELRRLARLGKIPYTRVVEATLRQSEK